MILKLRTLIVPTRHFLPLGGALNASNNASNKIILVSFITAELLQMDFDYAIFSITNSQFVQI